MAPALTRRPDPGLPLIGADGRLFIHPRAAGDERCDTLLTKGPYRIIRHPIYLAYSLAWLAAPVAMHSLPLGTTAAVMIGCYVVSAREEERRLAAGPLANKYRQYRARTWRLIPFLY